MDIGLRDKRVVVTGAANGIGTATYMALLEEGAFPIGIDILPLANSELERRLADACFPPHTYDFYQGDASDDIGMKIIFDGLDVLHGVVNSAGLLGGDKSHGGRNIKSWRKLIDSHATAAMVTTELAYPKMKQGGSIVYKGSIETDMAAPDVVFYTAAVKSHQLLPNVDYRFAP